MLKELYYKSLKLASHKSSKYFLAFISFIESFVFPIPPDVFIIPMTIAKREEWFKIFLIATLGSVLGACLGYFIGLVFFNEIGIKIFELYGVDNTSFLKEVIPAFPYTYQEPDGFGVARYDDIWSGLFIKNILDKLDKRMSAGFPIVSQLFNGFCYGLCLIVVFNGFVDLGTKKSMSYL